MHKGNICLNGLLCIAGGDRSLADFIELAIGPDGMAQIAYSDNAGTFTGTKGRVVWAKQVGGQSAYDTSKTVIPPVTVPGTKTTTPPGSKHTGGGLAATGLDRVLPAFALLLLLGLAVVQRRRRTPG
jgi:hypothetical protein